MAVGAAQCVLLLVTWTAGSGVHPGRYQLNQDGSWTVDWQTVEEAAARAAVVPPSTPPTEDQVKSGNFAIGFNFTHVSYEVLIARAILNAKRAGKLFENPEPDNSCPAK